MEKMLQPALKPFVHQQRIILSVGIIGYGSFPALGMSFIIDINGHTDKDNINRNLKLVTLPYFCQQFVCKNKMMTLPTVI